MNSLVSREESTRGDSGGLVKGYANLGVISDEFFHLIEGKRLVSCIRSALSNFQTPRATVTSSTSPTCYICWPENVVGRFFPSREALEVM